METERLILRRPEPADADAPIWFGIAPERHLAFAEEHWRVHGFGPWTAVLKETGEPVAAVDLHLAGPGITGVDEDEIEVGWVVAVDARGRGLATEAAAAVIAYAFDTLGVDEVVAYTSSRQRGVVARHGEARHDQTRGRPLARPQAGGHLRRQASTSSTGRVLTTSAAVAQPRRAVATESSMFESPRIECASVEQTIFTPASTAWRT